MVGFVRDGAGDRWLTGRRAAASAAALAAVLVTAGGAYGTGPGGDWPQAGHDASANRANTTEATITPANATRLTWVRGLAAAPEPVIGAECGAGWTAPVIAGGRAYAVQTGRLVAHDLATGALVWQRPLHTNPAAALTDVRRVYAVAGGRVFVGQLDCISQSDPPGSVRVFDAATGDPRWTVAVDGFTGLTVSGDRVVVTGFPPGAGNMILRVLAAATGAVVWEADLGEDCRVPSAVPIVVYDRVYSQRCSGDTRLTAARLADGVVAWRQELGLPSRGDSVGTVAKHLYVGNLAVNPANGVTRFPLKGASWVHAVDATRVYATCGTVLCAYTRATGVLLWTSAEPAAAAGADPALAGALLYTPTGAVLDAATGTLVTRLWTGEARALSVGNGYVAAVVDQRVLDLYSLPGR